MTGRTTDVAIVGGGLVGAWTAFFLARRGQRVTVLEKGVVGAQSSGVNFGNLRLQGRFPGQYPLSLRSQALWEEFEALTGEDCEFEQSGHLYLAYDAEEHARLESYAEVSESYGLAIERLEPADLRRRWPWLGQQAVAATFSARDATANPRLATPAVMRAAARHGASVRENTRVVDIGRSGDGFTLALANGETLSCGALVNSAGAWALEIAERFGETAPLFPAGPPQFVTEPFPYLIAPSIQAIDGSVIFRQIPRGNVILAGYPRTAADPQANRAPVPPAKTLAAMRALARVAPVLAQCHVIRVWSGIEAYLPDMIPVIGPSQTTAGLFHAFGFCGHGFQIGPGVGACLSEMILDGGTQTPLAPFGIGRFRSATQVSEKFRKEFD
ncbi:MAG: FAD-binding oxidoreductase [Bosea sp.]|uniref:NAD(P)/FAD-dependent oxidoreductase n=1 Tax=unclassified Bosea (in: a-proteobacteria) TaxID=2653178 RepID=UPI00096052DA|nr:MULTISPECIES: FAD-dependent oxidoreductase [unclassified Bosea (in: a-proteobacteria)]MBN9442016.1 FAD-binding oxidoreductase [Bosea sp. (in: a-proteobacteria)]MBN9455456.1 FAD-binding oxidoreductase [Bosea sp. (in: a-proteobacteria)]OJV05056.1 MAG: FAD-dependent oxidoreductase [Bosea sp. 67-29]